MSTTTFKDLKTGYRLKTNHKISKQTFLAKSSLGSRVFNELDIFRKQIIQGTHSAFHQPYTHKKKSVRIYRTVFLTFAFLFALLGFTAMSVPSAISFGFFSTTTTLKGLVLAFCTVLSLSSFLMGITMRTDREAVIHCLESGRRTLHTIYLRKKVQLGMMRFFTIFGPQRRQAKALHHMYVDIWEKMIDKKEETLHLISKISAMQTIDQDRKELLLNQAITELHDKLIGLANSFKHADSSID